MVEKQLELAGELRRVRGVELVRIAPNEPDMAAPRFEWVDPQELLIDERYQRALSERSLALIRRIVGAWDWRRFKPPVVATVLEGFEVIDGQHTAIAAATHPSIQKIPVMLVTAAEVADRATAFIGHNTERLGMTPMQLHFAAVTAGDMDAVQVQGICERCGVRVLRTPPSNGEYKIGDTVAVGAIRRLIVRRGDAGAERVLAALREAECAPLTATEIKAIEHLLYDEEFAGRISSGEIIQNLLKRSEYIAQQAKIFSATHRIPLWQALASVLFRDAYRRPSRTGSTAEDEALRQPLSRRA